MKKTNFAEYKANVLDQYKILTLKKSEVLNIKEVKVLSITKFITTDNDDVLNEKNYELL